MLVLAIDPGNVESAYVLMNESYKPLKFWKVPNEDMRKVIVEINLQNDDVVTVIEMVASYGMAVGREVFDTCVWIGKFSEIALSACFNNKFPTGKVEYIYRKDVKMNLCGQMKAKDSNIRQALVDRFAKHDLKNGKGTKGNPDWFYGFKADIWQSYALGVTYIDKELEKCL